MEQVVAAVAYPVLAVFLELKLEPAAHQSAGWAFQPLDVCRSYRLPFVLAVQADGQPGCMRLAFQAGGGEVDYFSRQLGFPSTVAVSPFPWRATAP